MHKKGFASVIIVLIVLVVAVSGAYFLGTQRNQGTSTNPASPTITQEQQPLSPTQPVTPAPNETASWKTYTNTQYGFSFKYPEEATYSQSGNDWRVVYMGETQKKSKRIQSELFDGYIVTITLYKDPEAITRDQAVQRTLQGAKDACPVPEEATFSDISTTTINGKQSKVYTVKNCMGDYSQYFLDHKTHVFMVTLLYVGDNEAAYKTEAEKILSTLTFTD